MGKIKRALALLMAVLMVFSLCGCRKKNKKNKDEPVAIAVVTPMPNDPFEVKLTPENLFEYFDYKEYRVDTRSETDSKILSSQISYGLQLKEHLTAANDPELKDTMKVRFEAAGVVLTGDYVVDFDTLQWSGPTYHADSKLVSEELVFWPKGDRTTNWAFGNYSSSYILYLEHFRITEVSGSVWLKRAEPKE
jgi:hypothetical protein